MLKSFKKYRANLGDHMLKSFKKYLY